MNKSRIFEYIAVTGLWAALVYQFIYPIFPGRLSSVTTFVLLVPLVIYWVLREQWYGVTMILMTNRAPQLECCHVVAMHRHSEFSIVEG